MRQSACCGKKTDRRKQNATAMKRVVVLLIPLLFWACHQWKTNPGILTIGLAEEPRSLNIWMGGDSNSAKVLRSPNVCAPASR